LARRLVIFNSSIFVDLSLGKKEDMTRSGSNRIWRSPVKTVLLFGFIAGSFDILAAIIVYTVIGPNKIKGLLQGIASGVLRKKAYSEGIPSALLGLFFHFLIAYCFVIGYFLLYPHLPFLRRQNIVSGLLYGIFVWVVMNLCVLPLVFPALRAPNWNSFFVGASILMVTIGLPVILMTNLYYRTNSKGLSSVN
jgi:hypothetical protein